MNLRKKICLLSVVMTLAACASQERVGQDVEELRVGPTTPPVKTITNFSSGLRCMDTLMIEHGVQDVAILVEDLEDRTSKVNAGTKDMLISAVSRMTRRSRAIKLVAFGNDSGNLVSFHAQAGSLTPYSEIPQYDIRGSISQLDSNLARRQEDAGLALDEFGIAPSRSTSGSVLGLDLSVLDSSDMAVIPGVVSSNSVTVFKSGAGLFTEATIQKTGLFYSFDVDRNEGTVQALRNLVELASIELIGKLVKLPYWRCLDIAADTPEVRGEVEDWFYAMQVHGELAPYIAGQLRNRGYYLGEDGSELRQAIAAFQADKGVEQTGRVDLQLFDLLLGHKPPTTETVAIETGGNAEGVDDAQLAAAPQATVASESNAHSAPAEAEIEAAVPQPSLSALGGKREFSPGEMLQLQVELSAGGYLYCYFEDEQSNIQRFFPNRFQQDNYLERGSTLTLPGELPFDIVAPGAGARETVACFASRENLYHRLAADLKSYDFENLAVASLAELAQALTTAGSGQVGEGRFVIQTR